MSAQSEYLTSLERMNTFFQRDVVPPPPQCNCPQLMAFDRSRGSQSLDAATMSELRNALTRSLETGSHGDDLKAALGKCAIEAKSKGILAEELLLSLKEVWFSLPPVVSQPGNEVQTRLLQQLVARCIQDYYAN